MALLAFPFAFPFTGASGSPLTAGVTPTPPPPQQDLPAASFALASAGASEGISPVQLEVRLSAVSGLTVKVDYAVTGGTATAGTDFALNAGTLTFGPGDVSELIPLAVADDALDETDETVVITLSNPRNATLANPTAHTYTIQDNDTAPTVAFVTASSGSGEGTSPAQLEVRLSAVSGLAVQVDYAATGGTATNGADYTLAAGTLTFAPGDNSENIAVTVMNDSQDETDETIVVTLSNPRNATLGNPAAHAYTIRDDDGVVVGGGNGGDGRVVIGNNNTIGVIIVGNGNTVGNVTVGGNNVSNKQSSKKYSDKEDDDHGGNSGKGNGKLAKESCKKGGWQTFTNPSFQNQGQCVSYFARLR